MGDKAAPQGQVKETKHHGESVEGWEGSCVTEGLYFSGCYILGICLSYKLHFIYFLIFIFLLFISTYNAWVISAPCPHPHKLHFKYGLGSQALTTLQ
jgi:hypothetical protein